MNRNTSNLHFHLVTWAPLQTRPYTLPLSPWRVGRSGKPWKKNVTNRPTDMASSRALACTVCTIFGHHLCVHHLWPSLRNNFDASRFFVSNFPLFFPFSFFLLFCCFSFQRHFYGPFLVWQPLGRFPRLILSICQERKLWSFFFFFLNHSEF